MQRDLIDRLLVARKVLTVRPLPLNEAARLACISPYHFHRSFVELFGETPHGFAMARRILRARELLQTSDMPVSRIAWELGFSTPLG